MERLQKVIAETGIASRRGAEQLILAGKVSVNGQVITVLGTKVNADSDRILVNGKALPKATERVTYLLNKPRGVVCSRKRQGEERLVTDFVPRYPAVYPIGRLDKESEGLILLTNDGALAHQLTHPSFLHTKEYLVFAKPEKDTTITMEEIKRKLEHGVKLGDGKAQADRVSGKKTDSGYELRITVHEGRHHLLRRLCATVNLKVTRLIRVKIGILALEKLPVGQHRQLTPEERQNIYATFQRSA